jgi:hypothetical protein
VRAAQRRRALDELEPVREEDADQRAVRGVEQALGRRAVDLEALGLAGLEADAQLVLAVAVVPMDLHAHHASGPGVEAHQLALVRRPARAPGAPEVQRLQEVRLARAVGPVHDREPLAQPDLGRGVAAEVPQAQARHDHGGLRRSGGWA